MGAYNILTCPKRRVADADADGGRLLLPSWLLFWDLSPTHNPPQITTASPQYAASVADRLADLARGLDRRDPAGGGAAPSEEVAEGAGGAAGASSSTAPPGQVDILWRIAGARVVYIRVDL